VLKVSAGPARMLRVSIIGD